MKHPILCGAVEYLAQQLYDQLDIIVMGTSTVFLNLLPLSCISFNK